MVVKAGLLRAAAVSGKLSFGSGSNGSATQLAGEIVAVRATSARLRNI
jgi:hypothetical protein